MPCSHRQQQQEQQLQHSTMTADDTLFQTVSGSPLRFILPKATQSATASSRSSAVVALAPNPCLASASHQQCPRSRFQPISIERAVSPIAAGHLALTTTTWGDEAARLRLGRMGSLPPVFVDRVWAEIGSFFFMAAAFAGSAACCTSTIPVAIASTCNGESSSRAKLSQLV